MRRAWRWIGRTALVLTLAFVGIQLWFLSHILYWSKFEVGSTE